MNFLFLNYAIVPASPILQTYTGVVNDEGGKYMGYQYGYSGGYGYGYGVHGFALIVVLFILLIIVGTHYKQF